eukprot:TRINITY_DN2503_c0_g1_i1.p1 TRINITY_DN2503_c0_g1~~TRINITY_DN2503_c0_g1_i1.p1  ORF type:complete len:703 (-),score=184.87 TRINITY_DN2503_c0_g1_i1:15-2123(-)
MSNQGKGQKRKRVVGKNPKASVTPVQDEIAREHNANKKKRMTFDEDGAPVIDESTNGAFAAAATTTATNNTHKRRASKGAGADEDGGSEGGASNNKKNMGMKQKKRKLERKKHDKSFDVMAEIKKLWEEARLKDLSKEERQPLIDKLVKLCTGRIKEIIFKHDGARVVQCIARHGDTDQRQIIINELSGQMVELAKTTYSRFLVKKLLRHGTKDQRTKIIKEFFGKVKQLIRHKEAAVVMEYIYSEIASRLQRAIMISEFYGPAIALAIAASQSQKKPMTLAQALAADPDQKPIALNNMKETIEAIIEKGLLQHSLAHKLILDYLTYTDDEGKKELIALLHDAIAHILHTKEGGQIGVIVSAYGAPKDRKAVVKSFKGLVTKVAQEECGYIVLLSLLDVTDDTVLTTKSLLGELLKGSADEQAELVNNRWAKQVFLHALAPRATKYFTPDVLRVIVPAHFTDPATGEQVPTSKKAPEVRRKQVLDFLLPQLLKLFASSTQVLNKVVTSINGTHVLYETLMHASPEQRLPIFRLLARLAGENTSGNEEEEEAETKGTEEEEGEGSEKNTSTNILSDFTGSRFLSRVIKADPALGKEIAAAQSAHFPKWATQKGASFVVVSLLESPDEEVKAQATKVMQPHVQALKDVDVAGTKVIVKLLSGEAVAPPQPKASPKAKAAKPANTNAKPAPAKAKAAVQPKKKIN